MLPKILFVSFRPESRAIGKAEGTTEKPLRAEVLRFLYDAFHRFYVKIGIGVQEKGASDRRSMRGIR